MAVIQKSFYRETLDEMLAEWNDPLGDRSVSEAENLINALQIELAGKEEVIKELSKDIQYYRKDWKDQIIQDQGI